MKNTTRQAFSFYCSFTGKVSSLRKGLGRPLTYTEKILFSHLFSEEDICPAPLRGSSYLNFSPDRVAMQDATAQMALLQFLNAGKENVCVPASIHCDHLIVADKGVSEDLPAAKSANAEIYSFLHDVARRYGIDFWGPGEGIIHQIVLENYALPGGMMIGTDSHTPNAGGLGMVAIGVGGADAVDVLTGQGWELKVPRIVGVHLTGRLSPWASPKDVILHILSKLTVKGGTNRIFEYFGEGVKTISATGRATICNMGAELGATCSLFPYDGNTKDYLIATGREDVADLCEGVSEDLRADKEVYDNPSEFFDEVLDIDLSGILPRLSGPFTPDAGRDISEIKKYLEDNGYPMELSVGLVGSCTNSSYEDLLRCSRVLSQALNKNIPIRSRLLVNPGSERILRIMEREGILDIFKRAGATIMTCACGACIGQWNRYASPSEMSRNSIVTSFNRNFRSRADGNPDTFAFIASPEMVCALSIAGRLDFNPITDTLTDGDGNPVMLTPPSGSPLPLDGKLPSPRDGGGDTCIGCAPDPGVEISVSPSSKRLQLLLPFPRWNGKDIEGAALLIKVQGKCTTDHISQAGKWLRFRGHLENISENFLMGATNSFSGKADSVLNPFTSSYDRVSAVARYCRDKGTGSIVIAEENYGEGSSREHAAMEARFLGVHGVVAKSFARIHETNLKKQGVLALTFKDPANYALVREDDTLSIVGLESFSPLSPLLLILHHSDGSSESVEVSHTYNDLQIEWFKAGSALNYLREKGR